MHWWNFQKKNWNWRILIFGSENGGHLCSQFTPRAKAAIALPPKQTPRVSSKPSRVLCAALLKYKPAVNSIPRRRRMPRRSSQEARSTVCRFCLVRRRRSVPPLLQWWSATTPLLTLIRSSGKLMDSEIAMNFRGEVSWFVTGSDLGVVPIFLWEGLGSESIADLKVEDRVHLYCSWLLTDLHFHLVLSRNRNICIQSHRSCLLQYRRFLASRVKCKDPSLSLFLLLLEQYIRDLCNKDAGQVTREKGQSEFPV
jgi:hypothetical protein